MVSKLFRAYGLYNKLIIALKSGKTFVSKLFRAYGLYNRFIRERKVCLISLFQSSFELTGYITTTISLDYKHSFSCFKALSSLRVI